MVSAAKIYHDYKDAVVLIVANGYNYQFSQSQSGLSITNRTKVQNNVTGFLIEENYIVAPLNAISGLTTLTIGGGNFVSGIEYNIGAVAALPEINHRINFYEIKVRVTNVNGSHCNVVYTARVVGIDAARNIAVLRIEDLDAANQGIIPLTCEHPHLYWGKSQDLCYGDDVFVLTANRNGALYVDDGNVTLPLYVDNELPLVEQVVIGDVDFTTDGSPVIDEKGRVIGVVIADVFFNINVVATQHQIQYIVDALIAGLHGPLGCHLTQTTSNLGPINVFVQPELGFDYKVNFDGNSLFVDNERPDYDIFPTGLLHLCSLCYCNSNYCLGVAKKHVQPIQVLFKATVGDVVVYNGVNGIETPVPFQVPVVLKAPTDQDKLLRFSPFIIL